MTISNFEDPAISFFVTSGDQSMEPYSVSVSGACREAYLWPEGQISEWV